MGKVMRALGLMSGTSLDGIDCAILETDGESHVVRGPAATFPYADGVRKLLLQALRDATKAEAREDRLGAMRDAETELTRLHAEAVSRFLAGNGLEPKAIDVIGFHGQTVLHRPDAGLTIQLGLGDMLADLTGCRVVYDMRAADVAAGGEGAPLVPVYHQALTAKLPQMPIAVVNIGGVANVTFIGADGRLIAFDTGPGNALLDDWMQKKAGKPHDENGTTAASGSVHNNHVHFYLNHSFFAAAPPKSLDRNAFILDVIDDLNLADGAATLAALTAAAIAKAREHLPEEPALWIICGGGRRNKAIMRLLAQAVENAVVPAEVAGLDGDSVEAEAWAYLAVRSLNGLPLTFPETTGVAVPTTGGIVAQPRAAATTNISKKD